jgi:hypothetical protein
MASYIASLKDDLANGFSKRDLEVLIGLPKNSLASILTNKRTLSLKSQLKIKRWNESEKPDPLDITKDAMKEMELAKIKSEYKGGASGQRIDIEELEQPALDESQINAIRDQIKAIRAEKIPDHRNTRIGRISWNDEQQKRISELQAKLNP